MAPGRMLLKVSVGWHADMSADSLLQSKDKISCDPPDRSCPSLPARKQPSGVRASDVIGPRPASYRSTGCSNKQRCKQCNAWVGGQPWVCRAA